jgi:hypothetical protein
VESDRRDPQHTEPDASTAMPIGARIVQFDDVIPS